MAVPGSPKHGSSWVEVKLPLQHPSQPSTFSGQDFQRGPSTTRLRRLTKNFPQWHLIFFPQVKTTSCYQQLSQGLARVIKRLCPSNYRGAANVIARDSRRHWCLPYDAIGLPACNHSWDLRARKGGELGMCLNSSKPLQMLQGKFSPPRSFSL